MNLDELLYDSTDAQRKPFKLSERQKNAIYFICAAVIINILAIIYIAGSKFIYFWDDSTYWDIARKMATGAFSEGGFWHNVYASIGEQDYNYIAALPSAIIVRIFGESRMAYILGLVNMYLMPSLLLIHSLAKKVSKAPKIATAIAVLLCPSMLFLAFNGFVDIGGLFICLLCFNLYYPKKEKSDSLWRYICIGLLLTASMLWRRWFAFFAVSFVTAMLADCVLFKRSWYKVLCAPLISGIILLLFFRDFLLYKLLADYGSLYAGYKFSISTDFKLITRYFGLIFIALLAVCSVVTGVKKKETKPIFMWIQMLVCLFMFVSTQTHGQQHLLLYIPSIIMLTLILIKHITKEWALVGISVLALLHSINVYIPRTQPQNIQEIKHMALIPNFSMLPTVRSDAEQILDLKQRLDAAIPSDSSLGVLASSFTINESILQNVEPSFGIKASRPNYIISLPQVDSRDRDLSALYNADYILVVTPAQTHLAEGSQTVITESVRSFEEYTDIATAYQEDLDFETVIGDMTIKLFYRTRDEHTADISSFEARLYQ